MGARSRSGGQVVGGLTRRSLLLSGVGGVLAGCDRRVEAPAYAPAYGARPAVAAPSRTRVLGVHPLHNPQRLFALYGPIVDHLNAAFGREVRLVLEASRNYDEFDKKLYGRHFDLALPNPYQTLNAMRHGYRVFAKMGDDTQFRGIIVLRRDSPVKAVTDLRGRAISFPARTALAATMLPQQFLHDHGLPLAAYDAHYVGSQESSIMNVVLGNTAAGATWPPPWHAFELDHPASAALLKVKWQTATLPNNSLMARDDFPPDLLQRIGDTLCRLHESGAGRELLAPLPLSRFEPADATTYAPVVRFVERFATTVRPLDEPR